MHRPISLLVVGRLSEHIAPIINLLGATPNLKLTTHVSENGGALMLDADALPDAVLLGVGDDWRDHLPQLVQKLPTVRPPFVVVGTDADVDLLRAAMRAGARDAVTIPFDADDLLSALATISEEERLRTGVPSSRIVSFMNSKGGSGATFIAANVALALATMQQGRTLVVDADFQFGSMPTYVDMHATNGLIKALEFADTLDEAALQGYVQEHKSGLHLLAAAMTDIILPEDVSEHRVKQLLRVLDGAYRYIVFDLPRRIDSATAAMLMQSDEIVIVTQQTLSHLQDTKRLMFLLQNQLDITPDRLRLIVNRYDKKADVRLDDFTSVLLGVTVETMPGDYPRVAESINLGVPLVEGSPRSALGKRLIALARTIAVGSFQVHQHGSGLFGWLSRPAQH
jgi:pilus assembly protein CpaE